MLPADSTSFISIFNQNCPSFDIYSRFSLRVEDYSVFSPWETSPDDLPDYQDLRARPSHISSIQPLAPVFEMYSRTLPNAQTPKLRASCDTCFLAKVRCSKARPMCSRCLAFGAECKYSPSSRTGKPKLDGGRGSRPSKTKESSTTEDSKVSHHTNHHPTPLIPDTEDPALYFLDTDWSTTPASDSDGQDNRCWTSPTVMPIYGDQGSSKTVSPQDSGDLSDPYLYWSPTPDITSPYIDNSHQLQPKSLADTSVSPSTTLWADQTESNYFSSTTPCDPRLGPMPNLFMDECLARTTTCDCFNTCLQALQTLHNFNAVPLASSFDIVLTVNQKAMETCSTTLNCPICNAKSGSDLRTMLLGMILGRIISIYQDTSRNYFGPRSNPGSHLQSLPLTFGIYQVANEDIRWLQLVIILRDLKKFKGLLAKFQETIDSGSEEDVHSAVTNHLYQSLHITCEALKKHKNFAWGEVD